MTRRGCDLACACSCRPVCIWKDEAALLPHQASAFQFVVLYFPHIFATRVSPMKPTHRYYMPDDPTAEPTNATSAYFIFGDFSFLTMQLSRSPNKPYCCRFETYSSGNERFCRSRGRRWYSLSHIGRRQIQIRECPVCRLHG